MNKLPLGSARVGSFIDFIAETPEVQVTLTRSKQAIEIVLPWSDPASTYASWFVDPALHHSRGTDHDPIPAPSRVLFSDSRGTLMLVGCWTQGSHYNVMGSGSGRFRARAAVMHVDRDIDFERPHGLKSEVAGLREWLDVTSWNQTIDWQSIPGAVTLESDVAPTIEVGTVDGLSVTLVPSWHVGDRDDADRIVLHDRLRCTTRTKEPTDWEVHLDVHAAIRDLLVLSRWRDVSLIVVAAHRKDDSVRTMDGKTHGFQWRDVIVSDDEPTPPPRSYRPHLIRYEDLGPLGLRNWCSIRTDFARALDPVISSIDLSNTTPETVLAHTGPGIEALGYLLAVRAGLSARQAKAESLAEGLARLTASLSDALPPSLHGWDSRFVTAYNGLKHANRRAPDSVEVLNAWREAVMVVRAWIATELGVGAADLRSRLENDAQRHPFVQRN